MTKNDIQIMAQSMGIFLVAAIGFIGYRHGFDIACVFVMGCAVIGIIIGALPGGKD